VQAEASIDLAIPIVATNLMVEFETLHDVSAAGLPQRMLCPRCNRPVTDRHGICRHCRENAFQCRLCRNINYENLDAFLCNECGYCKHARFDYSLVCTPSFAVEPVRSEEDKHKAMQARLAPPPLESGGSTPAPRTPDNPRGLSHARRSSARATTPTARSRT